MTLEQFRATRRVVDDVGAVIGDTSFAHEPGVMYLNTLWILGPDAEGNYDTIIERSEYHGSLEELEVPLWEFAKDAGIIK